MNRFRLFLPFLACIAAANTLEFSDIDITTTISVGDLPTSHRGTLPVGDPTKIEVFGSIPLWGRFTIDPANQHSSSFMSAMGMTDRDMGVGVSGFRVVGGALNTSPSASVYYEWTVTNTGTTPIPVGINYKIPQMELWVTRFSAFSHAYGEARLEASHYLDDGSLLTSWKPYSYWARLYYVRDNGGPGLEESEDIQQYHPEAVTDSVSYERVTYPIIEGWKPLAILEPGESLDLSYRLLTYVYSGAEAGGQAFVGDPFTITGDGPPVEIFIGTSPTSDVPEPATAGLIAAALAIFIRRRKS